MRLRLGIAVTTFNRREMVLKLAQALKERTEMPFDLVICDDGSEDGTWEAVKAQNIPIVGGKQRGIAWNKNRGIYYLFNIVGADIVLLLDDDMMPAIFGWEKSWVMATQHYGHINYLPDYAAHSLIAGERTLEEIGISTLIDGSCIGISRKAFSLVGYMDSRFGRYGHEHVEYTNRFIREGFGGCCGQYQGNPTYFYYSLSTGIALEPNVPSSGTAEEAEANRLVFERLGSANTAPFPWHSARTKSLFLAEMAPFLYAAKTETEKRAENFDPSFYLTAYPDVAAAGMRPLEHYLKYGYQEGRKPYENYPL